MTQEPGNAPPTWTKTPWVEPQDTARATFSPDEYAWQLFVSLNWPASDSACGPDPSKTLGAAGPRTWEQWASKRSIFLNGGATPQMWDQLCPVESAGKTLAPNSEREAVRTQLREKMQSGLGGVFAEQSARIKIFIDPPQGDVSNANDEEVRMNRPAFDFVRENALYKRSTLKKMAADGVRNLDFPHASKEIKAHWIVLRDAKDFSRYYTATIDGKTYGLVAFHITTKDLPRWFWATFEHVDNEKRWSTAMPLAFAGWGVEPVDSFACPEKPAGCNRAPPGIGLEGTAFQNYRLKFAQTDWVTLTGVPVRAVNSKIEGGFIQTKSSCISCHSLALVGAKSPSSIPFEITTDEVDADGRVANFVGVVKPSDRIPATGTDPNDQFMQLDFVWALRNAK
jgi:hypothetical protein